MTMPPPLGSGNANRINRPLIQASTAGLPIVLASVVAEDTVPSLAMTNFTVIFPPNAGFFVISRW